MQKYSKKKGIWETSMEMNDGLCCFILVVLIGFISLITGILVRKIFGFMSNLGFSGGNDNEFGKTERAF